MPRECLLEILEVNPPHNITIHPRQPCTEPPTLGYNATQIPVIAALALRLVSLIDPSGVRLVKAEVTFTAGPFCERTFRKEYKRSHVDTRP
jgi:hypothetical protein